MYAHWYVQLLYAAYIRLSLLPFSARTRKQISVFFCTFDKFTYNTFCSICTSPTLGILFQSAIYGFSAVASCFRIKSLIISGAIFDKVFISNRVTTA